MAASMPDSAVSPIDFDQMQRVGDICAYHARRSPEKAALIFEGRSTSWRTVDERATRIAAALLAQGLQPGDRVGFVGKNSDLFFELMFGTARAGMVLVPAQWRLAASELTQVFEDAGARIVFIGADQYDRADTFGAMAHAPTIVAMGDHPTLPSFARWRDSARAAPSLPDVDPASVAWQVYTSGTTGKPKGVMLSHRSLLSGRREAIDAHMAWNEWRDDDITLVVLPVGHVGGVGWALVGLYYGATTIVHAEFVPAMVLDALTGQGVSKLLLVPTAMQMLLALPDIRARPFPRLRHILYGASPIALDLLREAVDVFKCGFCQQYGMTETCGTIVYLPPEDHDPAGTPRMRAAGLPMPGVELRVVHPQTRAPQPTGEVGEVETRSIANMTGYWRQPDATAQTIDEQGWLKTGDAGYLDADGYLYIQDRFKDMICSGGENVFPAEVESAIYGHPAVQEVAVIGVPDGKWGEAVKAIVVPRPGSNPDAQAIMAFARERIAAFKAPKSVDFVEALPRNPSGKILRRELRDPYWQGQERKVN